MLLRGSITPFLSLKSSSLPNRRSLICKCSAGNQSNQTNVIIVGGTGRVGSSAARALASTAPHLHLILAGRNRHRGETLAAEIGGGTEFREVDIEDMLSVEAALHGVDLIIHAAGPFQQQRRCTVLEAAIRNKTAYLDVCDDVEYSRLAKSLLDKASAANVSAITMSGIYPGVSNIMAAELVRMAISSGGQPERLRFSYFTAGSGGAGPTILATSFLLLGEEVIAYRKGDEIKMRPYSGELQVDFGKGVGKKSVYLLNLPEVASAREVFNIPSISARFGTAPDIWNWAMGAVANFVPREFLEDRTKVNSLVKLSYPFVNALDGIAGELMSMRVDLEYKDGKKAVGLFTHRKFSVCVGIAIAAFVKIMLEGKTQPGVWYPEQEEGISLEARRTLLEHASSGTINFVMNRPPWMLESDPKEIGFGIYLQ